jgi:hypothetical protein
MGSQPRDVCLCSRMHVVALPCGSKCLMDGSGFQIVVLVQVRKILRFVQPCIWRFRPDGTGRRISGFPAHEVASFSRSGNAQEKLVHWPATSATDRTLTQRRNGILKKLKRYSSFFSSSIFVVLLFLHLRDLFLSLSYFLFFLFYLFVFVLSFFLIYLFFSRIIFSSFSPFSYSLHYSCCRVLLAVFHQMPALTVLDWLTSCGLL